MLRDFWDKSKGVSKVFELTLFAEIVLWPGFEGLVASNSPEKSKGFFWVSCVTFGESFFWTNDPLQTHEKDGL